MFLSLLTAFAFYSISVWVSGDAVVGALVRLLGIPDSEALRGVVYLGRLFAFPEPRYAFGPDGPRWGP